MNLSISRLLALRPKGRIVVILGFLWPASITPAESTDSVPQVSPSSHIDTQSWTTREVKEIRLRFKLPQAYKEKKWDVTVGSGSLRSFRSGSFDDLHFEMERGEALTIERAKVVRQRDYVDYKEWNELVAGHRAIIQTFQGGGIIFDKERQIAPYRVEAVCVLDATRLLRITSTSATQKTQQEVLAMLRTMEFYDNVNDRQTHH